MLHGVTPSNLLSRNLELYATLMKDDAAKQINGHANVTLARSNTGPFHSFCSESWLGPNSYMITLQLFLERCNRRAFNIRNYKYSTTI